MKDLVKVTYARLQQAIHVPHAGELGNVIPGSKKLHDLQMHTDFNVLFLSFKHNGIQVNAAIPMPNVSVLLYTIEETPKLKTVK